IVTPVARTDRPSDGAARCCLVRSTRWNHRAPAQNPVSADPGLRSEGMGVKDRCVYSVDPRHAGWGGCPEGQRMADGGASAGGRRTPADPLAESLRIVDVADRQGLLVRLMGGMAIRAHAPDWPAR